jgi:vancomycin resistance protein YoaR
MTDELTIAPAPALDADIAVEQPGASARRRTWQRFVVAFLVGLIAALAIGAGALYAFDRTYEGRVLPGVRVGGVDLSGMAPSQARTTLTEAFASFGEGQAILVGGGHEMAIPYAKISRRPDVDAMVAEAMTVGRSGNAVERAILDARTAIRGVDLVPRVLLDEAKLARYVQTHAGRLFHDPEDAAVRVTADGFAVDNAIYGQTADRVPATEFLLAALTRSDAPSEIRVPLEVSPVEPEVTTAEATQARLTAERIARDIVISHGEERWAIPAATIRSWLTFEAAPDGAYEPVVGADHVTAALTEIAKEVEQTPVNATFTTSGSKITGVTAHRDGRALDVAVTAERVSELIASRAENGEDAPVEPALTVTPPKLTTEAAEAAIPKMKRISTWTTYFPISEKNGFGANIWIPAIDIDGYVVAPGDTFDFWKAVGPVTRARGYRDGGAIINGKTEPQGALAGGICSCSTTLFNAALRAGFEMGARRNHYYYIDRYPLGLDATVFKSGSGSVQTMSWVNDTGYPVLIRGFKIKDGAAGYVRFDLYSVPTGRKVTFSTPVVKNVRRATDTVQTTSTLAPGVRKRIEYPVDGKDVWVTRTVRDAAGKVIHQETYYSHYARITGVTLVGKAP